MSISATFEIRTTCTERVSTTKRAVTVRVRPHLLDPSAPLAAPPRGARQWPYTNLRGARAYQKNPNCNAEWRSRILPPSQLGKSHGFENHTTNVSNLKSGKSIYLTMTSEVRKCPKIMFFASGHRKQGCAKFECINDMCALIRRSRGKNIFSAPYGLVWFFFEKRFFQHFPCFRIPVYICGI